MQLPCYNENIIGIPRFQRAQFKSLEKDPRVTEKKQYKTDINTSFASVSDGGSVFAIVLRSPANQNGFEIFAYGCQCIAYGCNSSSMRI